MLPKLSGKVTSVSRSHIPGAPMDASYPNKTILPLASRRTVLGTNRTPANVCLVGNSQRTRDDTMHLLPTLPLDTLSSLLHARNNRGINNSCNKTTTILFDVMVGNKMAPFDIRTFLVQYTVIARRGLLYQAISSHQSPISGCTFKYS